MARPLQHMAYRMSQSARIGWFAANAAAVRRYSRAKAAPGEAKRTPRSSETQAALSGALRELFERDWANIEQGLYAAPYDQWQNPLTLLRQAHAFFRDLPAVDGRRRRNGHAEVSTTDPARLYPRYYLQNFHYQTDGYLSEHSAKLYDYQVEVLFTGAADAMRRQALVPLHQALVGRDQRTTHLLDVACGTGRFLTFVKDNFPRLDVTALDLSADYLKQARHNLARWSSTDFIHANAENIPCAPALFDVVTCVYLFHELPPRVRPIVLKEITRVLKPGGTFIFVDSIQRGDIDGADALLDNFPASFHEPYYDSYTKEDLPARFADAGLHVIGQTPAFMSKVVVARKPAS